MEQQLLWSELEKYYTKYHLPQWMREAKFGIYTHWGIYSVPAFGRNVSWYARNMYLKGSDQYEYHCKTYGHPSKFGYKDFIPMFTAENFDPDEWAELFAQSGAGFAGPVAEHHDGFSMWDCSVNPWNSAGMGPKRDVAGELEKAIRKQGMKFMVALHHAENWWFYPHWLRDCDVSDPRWSGLYGPVHNLDWGDKYIKNGDWIADEKKVHMWRSQEKPDRKFFDLWLAKTKDLIDHCSPDMLWFDFGLGFVPELYKFEMMKYFLSTSREKGIDPLVAYKGYQLPVGYGMPDLEQGSFQDLTFMEWITDTTVDAGCAWGYSKTAKYKSGRSMIHYLIDNVSKNGYLLLNIGPTSKGEIPEPAKEVLREMGRWLSVNGEAIYGTTPWVSYGQGPTKLHSDGSFNEGEELQYTAEDIRFTAKDNAIYMIFLNWPENGAVVRDLPTTFYPSEIESVRMLGSEEPITWRTEKAELHDRWGWDIEKNDLFLSCPKKKPCDHAYVYKITRKPFRK